MNSFRVVFASLLVFFSFTAAGFAQTSPSKEFSNVKIKNFGQMDERFYRGAQPLPDDYQALKDLGIKTVIDLRNDPTDYEKSSVEALGMRYVHIPMSGWKTPKETDVEQFLQLVDDEATGAFFVHCKAGIHRTGVMGGAYRFTKYGWDYDKVYREMKNYEFSTGFLGLQHGSFKDFIRDYAEKMKTQKTANATTIQAAVPAIR